MNSDAIKNSRSVGEAPYTNSIVTIVHNLHWEVGVDSGVDLLVVETFHTILHCEVVVATLHVGTLNDFLEDPFCIVTSFVGYFNLRHETVNLVVLVVVGKPDAWTTLVVESLIGLKVGVNFTTNQVIGMTHMDTVLESNIVPPSVIELGGTNALIVSECGEHQFVPCPFCRSVTIYLNLDTFLCKGVNQWLSAYSQQICNSLSRLCWLYLFVIRRG